MVPDAIYLPEELHQGIKQAAKERGTSEAELIRTAVRHELLGAPADQHERAQTAARRALDLPVRLELAQTHLDEFAVILRRDD